MITTSNKHYPRINLKIFAIYYIYIALVDPILYEIGALGAMRTMINYFMIITLFAWSLQLYTSRIKELSWENRVFLNRIIYVVFMYCALLVAQLVINPKSSTIDTCRQIIVFMMPGTCLIIVAFLYSAKSEIAANKIIQLAYFLIVTTVLISFFSNLGADKAQRLAGVAGSSNELGFIASTCIIMNLLIGLNYIKVFRNKIIISGISMMAFLQIVYSGSYGAAMLCVSSVCLIPILSSRLKKQAKITISLVVAFIAMFIIVVNINPEKVNFKAQKLLRGLQARDFSVAIEGSTLDLRGEVNKQAVDKIWRRPLLGYGLDNRRAKKYSPEVRHLRKSVHNAFLGSAITTGIFSSLTIIFLYFVTLKRIKALNNPMFRIAALTLLFSLFYWDNLCTWYIIFRDGLHSYVIIICLLLLDMHTTNAIAEKQTGKEAS
ncbi:O-antigen ligase family protein [Candidatus Omnitrophota bacterium]